MIRTQVQLSEEQATALKRLAAERGVSMASLIRQGVDSVLASQSALSLEERWDRALAVLGKFRSDTGDVSARHDEHFAEAAES